MKVLISFFFLMIATLMAYAEEPVIQKEGQRVKRTFYPPGYNKEEKEVKPTKLPFVWTEPELEKENREFMERQNGRKVKPAQRMRHICQNPGLKPDLCFGRKRRLMV